VQHAVRLEKKHYGLAFWEVSAMEQSDDLGKVFDAHVHAEFVARDIDATMATMTDDPYVTHVPSRFKSLKAEYNVRTSCAGKIEQSLKDVALRDMAQAPEILKSMVDSIDADIKGISVAQAKVADVAEKIDAAQKAITTIRMIHRAMCAKEQHAVSQNDAARQ